MTEQQTIDYARRRLVELWVQLSDDHPSFLDQEGEFQRNDVVETVTGAHRLLGQGKPLPGEWNALVQLQALDAFLAEHSGTRATGVDAQLGTPVHLEDGKRYWLYRRPQGLRQAPVEKQPGHLRKWMKHHHVLPEKQRGYQVAFPKPSDYLLEQLSRMHERGEHLKVAIARFEDGVEPTWRREQSPARFQAEALTDAETRWKTVRHVLERAREERAHVLVLPELTVPPELRLRIQEWLTEHADSHALLLVLPGTFHEPDSRGKRVVNRTELLDAYGQSLLVHDKLLPFRAHTLGDEDIHPGRRISLLPLPLGLLATPICLDFCEADQPLPELWKELGPAWLLVPAMGDGSSRRAHARAARTLFVTRGSVTALANQPLRGGLPAPGFIYDGQKERDPTEWDDEAPGDSFHVVKVDILLEEP
jgi:hypothetical protein